MEFEQRTHPFVRFSLRHENLVIAAGVVLPLGVIGLIAWPDWNWRLGVAAALIAAVAGLAVRSYLEVLSIIADTLMPR